MMTPNTDAGRLTERIMLRVKTNLPQISTHDYNRIYESVLDGLNEEKERVNPNQLVMNLQPTPHARTRPINGADPLTHQEGH